MGVVYKAYILYVSYNLIGFQKLQPDSLKLLRPLHGNSIFLDYTIQHNQVATVALEILKRKNNFEYHIFINL